MLHLRTMSENDWPMVAKIYGQGIATGQATFEIEIPSWEKWDSSHLKACRFVAEREGEVIGWAALSPVSSRCVYGGVAEVSVYVSTAHLGQKIGSQLLKQLILTSEAEGFWTLQAGIFRENKASIKLHTALSFREIGYREKVGQMNGVWRDTILLERRSKLFQH